MSKPAVLVIDVQQGLCEGEGRAFDSDAVIARINRVLAQARAAGAAVVLVQHESASGYLEHGSRAWQLADGLHAGLADLRVRKTTPDAFHGTDLLPLLRRHDVTELIVCGMHTEFCVDTTIRRALALGYPVTLVADAHTSAGNAVLTPQQVIDHHNATLTNIASFGPRVRAVTADALVIGAGAASPCGLREPSAQTPDGAFGEQPAKLSAAVPILSVTDLVAALAYYQHVLGFALAWSWGDPPQLASVCRDGVELNLAWASDPPFAGSRVYVQMSGVDAYYRHAVQAGATIAVPLADRAYGMRDFRLVDIGGNEISFGEFRAAVAVTDIVPPRA